MQLPFEKFQALNVLAMCRHIFTRRIPGIHVSHDKAEALKRLESAHLEIRNAIGIGDWPLLTAQQIHGDKIACVTTQWWKLIGNSPAATELSPINAVSRWAFTSPTAAPFIWSTESSALLR